MHFKNQDWHQKFHLSNVVYIEHFLHFVKLSYSTLMSTEDNFLCYPLVQSIFIKCYLSVSMTYCSWLASVVLVCMFVCGFSSLSRIFDSYGNVTITCTVKGFKIWPMLGTDSHWQCGFFNVPHLLGHGSSVYNGYLREPMTLTPYAERLSVEL